MATHFAGIVLRVGDEIRQLCAWCGHRIVGALAEELHDERHQVFEPGDQVSVNDIGYARLYDGYSAGDGLPDDSCALGEET